MDSIRNSKRAKYANKQRKDSKRDRIVDLTGLNNNNNNNIQDPTDGGSGSGRTLRGTVGNR